MGIRIMGIRIRYKESKRNLVSSTSYLAQDKILSVSINMSSFRYKILDQYGYKVTSGLGSSISNAKLLAKKDLKILGVLFNEETRTKLQKLKEMNNES